MSRTTTPCRCEADTSSELASYVRQMQMEIRAIEEIFHCLILLESVLDPANAITVLDVDDMASWLRFVNKRFSARINAIQDTIDQAIVSPKIER